MGRPTVEEIAQAIYMDPDAIMLRVEAENAARAVIALLERKAEQPDGKPDPAPVASETCDHHEQHCPVCCTCADCKSRLPAGRPRKDRP